MSLLNRPSHGIYPVLIAIFKFLLNRKNLTKDQILKLCAPPEACSQEHTNNTLNTWTSLGLFAIKPDEEYRIHPDIPRHEQKPENLSKIARNLVLRPENNKDLWAKEDSGSSDFTLGLSWFLAQDAWTTELGGWPQAEELSRYQMPPGKSVFQNDTRWPGFKEWASYLGFGFTLRHAAGISPDPTEAIRSALPAVFGKHKILQAKDFIRQLADQLPVLDGGDYRIQVETVMLARQDQYSWKALPEGQLSTSLSRAILRLHEEGILRHKLKADTEGTDRVRLTGRATNQIRNDISEFSFHP
jgi:hypothetical protein